MAEEKKHFWEGLPAILTGIAAVITAIAGLIALFLRPGSQPVANPPAAVVEPETPRVPAKPVRVQRVNIQGDWTEPATGNKTRIFQDGNRITFMTVNAFTGQQLASGTGSIDGRTISCRYRWFDGTPLTAKLTLSSDDELLSGTYRNTLTGQSGSASFTR